MKTIAAELNRVAEEVCDNICKHKDRYTAEEWEAIMETKEWPCLTCPLTDIIS